MRRFLWLSVLAVSTVLALVSCNSKEKGDSLVSKPLSTTTPVTINSPDPANNLPSDGVRRVTIGELRDAVEKKTAVIIDVRPLVSYEQNHIAGAIHIPVEDFPRRIGEVPRDKMIVTYCS